MNLELIVFLYSWKYCQHCSYYELLYCYYCIYPHPVNLKSTICQSNKIVLTKSPKVTFCEQSTSWEGVDDADPCLQSIQLQTVWIRYNSRWNNANHQQKHCNNSLRRNEKIKKTKTFCKERCKIILCSSLCIESHFSWKIDLM